MSFDHDIVTGAFICPWCSLKFAEPTRRSALHSWDGPIGLADTYSHVCVEPHVTHPTVLIPFPDRAEWLSRRVREACEARKE